MGSPRQIDVVDGAGAALQVGALSTDRVGDHDDVPTGVEIVCELDAVGGRLGTLRIEQGDTGARDAVLDEHLAQPHLRRERFQEDDMAAAWRGEDALRDRDKLRRAERVGRGQIFATEGVVPAVALVELGVDRHEAQADDQAERHVAAAGGHLGREGVGVGAGLGPLRLVEVDADQLLTRARLLEPAERGHLLGAAHLEQTGEDRAQVDQILEADHGGPARRLAPTVNLGRFSMMQKRSRLASASRGSEVGPGPRVDVAGRPCTAPSGLFFAGVALRPMILAPPLRNGGSPRCESTAARPGRALTGRTHERAGTPCSRLRLEEV
ncbi:hypothetical protein [Nannocystis sp.]|uniref:hypothetical protein n=1 Tax=Nannocystis sp. TaxID=1962667 RepID=UPI0025FECC3B|nr:hypothetical protein [Nannocystis sp.]